LERPRVRKPSGYHVLSIQAKDNSQDVGLATKQESFQANKQSLSRKQALSSQYAMQRKSVDAASLAALTGTPIQSYFPPQPHAPRVPTTPVDEGDTSASRGRRSGSMPPSAHLRQSSSKSLSRARDSVHYTANNSRARSTSTSNRRSIQRDTLHYDPSSHHRNRSGSIQGRPVDFSKPRETPFSDRSVYDLPAKGHTPQSSTDSENTLNSYYTTSRSARSSHTTYTDASEPAATKGSRLRTTMDNFGTKDINPFADPQVSFENKPQSSIINHKLSSSLDRLQQEENLKRSGTVSVAKVERRKPQRVSSHGEEWDIDVRPGFARIETGSTSSSPVVGSPGVQERFPAYVRM
jgi:hypothetical protein